MKAQSILTGLMALGVALVVSGCSGGKFPSADQVFKSASSQPAPRSAEDRSARSELALARLSERRGQPEHAERLYQRLLEKDPQNPVPYHRLGVMRAKEGRFEEANEHFEEALRLAPSDAKLLSDIGYCYYLQHRVDEAEEILRRAAELRPNDPAICNNLAVLLGEQGRDSECLTMFRRTGSEAHAYANMAFVHAQRGELEKAKASYGRALTLDQNLKPAAEALVQIAQHEERSQPSPSMEPMPQADSLLSEIAPSAAKGREETAWPQIEPTPQADSLLAEIAPSVPTRREEEIVWPQMPQTVGPLVASSQDDTGAQDDAGSGTVTVTDSTQPASFEQTSAAAAHQAPFPAQYPKMWRPEVDFAYGLGSLVSQAEN